MEEYKDSLMLIDINYDNMLVDDFEFDPQFFDLANAHDIYFIPKKVSGWYLELGIDKMIGIETYLELVTLIVENHYENRLGKYKINSHGGAVLYANTFKSVYRDYKMILDVLKKNGKITVHDSRDGKVRMYANEYIINGIDQMDVWQMITLEKVNDIKITIKNSLPVRNVMNNRVMLDVLEKAELDFKNAMLYEWDQLSKELKMELLFVSEKKKMIAKYFGKFASRLRFNLKFKYKRSIQRGTNVDRIYNSFSMLSSNSRHFVSYNGKKFCSLDIKNCQPTLLMILAYNNNVEVDDTYREAVLGGRFYETLQEEAARMYKETEDEKYLREWVSNGKKGYFVKFNLDLNDYQDFEITEENITMLKKKIRKGVKELSYRSIFFNWNPRSRVNKIFCSLYPKMAEFLNVLKIDEKTTKGKKMAYYLQNLEADVMLHRYKDTPYFTVHDAIYYTEESMSNYIKEIINEKIKEKSCGKIQEVVFEEGEIISTENIKCVNLGGVVELKKINRKRKYNYNEDEKSKLQEKLNKFASLYHLSKEEVMKEMQISQDTFYRLKRKLKNK